MMILLPSAASSAAPTDGVLFTNEDGKTNTAPTADDISAGGTDLTLTEFGTTSGWYCVTANVTFTGKVDVVGNVYLIIADGCVMTVPSGGISVPSGSSLTTYSQTLGSDKGKLKSAGSCVALGGGSLTNVAAIEGANAVLVNGGGIIHNYGTIAGTSVKNTVAVKIDTAETVAIINHNGGLIRGLSGIQLTAAAGSTIDNYGEIIGTSPSGPSVGTTTDAAITNHNGGLIQGLQYGIRMNGGGIVNNSGVIRALNDSFAYTIYANKPCTVINTDTGLIETNEHGIWLLRGGTVINSGAVRPIPIAGGDKYGPNVNAVYANGTTNVINNAGGLLEGNTCTILFEGCGGSVDNSGEIRTLILEDNLKRYGIEAGYDGATEPINIINRAGGIIKGANYAIVLHSGGSIYNYGTIEGPSFGVYTFDSGNPFSFLNEGTVKGNMRFSGDINEVTLAAGSKITGTFNIGANPDSKLTFTGNPGASLVFTVVGGNANIGSAEVRSNQSQLPANLQPGTVIVLIDGSAGTMSGTPANTVLWIGGYEFELSIEDNKLIATLQGTVTPPGPITPPSKDFYITASAGPGAAISPEGKIIVSAGGSRTFSFTAAEGYSILAVLVDGVYLSYEDIVKGSYTFYSVRANHRIEVTATTAAAVLTIIVVEGKGYAEYSVNGGSFTKYESPVSLPINCSLIVIAYADNGYGFNEWRNGMLTYPDAEIRFAVVTASLNLDLYFADIFAGNLTDKDQDMPLGMIGLLLLLIAGILLLLIARRRRYEVVKNGGSASIIGEDKVSRKAAYRFSVEGEAGMVSYRIEGNGIHKPLFPDEDGVYVIPKGEITGGVTIECG
jgi:hypothetical protein